MSLADPIVFSTINDDGSADFTISVDEDDHKFSLSQDGNVAVLSYEETLSWRGEIRVSEPRNEIFKLLMQSKQMTEYLESHDLSKVTREKHV
jgi:hypothetical protein